MAIRPSPASKPAVPPTAAPTHSGARASRFCTVILAVEIAIRERTLVRFAIGGVPVVGVARDDVDIVVRDTGRLEVTNGLSSVGIAIVEP
jgi:hypothetical protein